MTKRAAAPEKLVVDLPYDPTPRQQIFHSRPERFLLYGGAAGGGKSEATYWEPAMLALEFPGWQALVLRREFPELQQSLIRRFRANMPPETYTWIEGTTQGYSGHTAVFNNAGQSPNGQPSAIRFAHCQNPDDVLRFKSDQYDSIHFDELTSFTYPMWRYLRTRNRATIPGHKPKMTGATNPEGIGLEWVKALWIDKEPCADMDADEAEKYLAEKNDYHFTPAKISDNPYMLLNDPGYIKNLEAMPRHIRLALLDGRWDVLAGAFFDVWDAKAHIQLGIELEGKAISPDEVIGLEDWHPRWISVDYGWTHHAAVYWNALVGKVGYTYREMVVKRTTPKVLAQTVGIVSDRMDEKIRKVYMGPDSFAERHAAHTIALEFDKAGEPYGLPPAERAADDREGGALLCYQMLQSVLWVVSERCPKLIKAIPSRQTDPKKERDVLKIEGSELDDAYDAWRYGVYSEMRQGKKPIEEQVRERVTSKDPTMAMAQMRKAEFELRQRQKPVRPRTRRW